MAADIVPIELGLTAGDLVTLWAPRWREDGEEWEAFLGGDDDLFAFPDVAALVAFIRTVPEHDLADHPAWRVVPELAAPDLVPEESHRYDLVGVPELVADRPDTWTVGELGDIVAIVRSLADVCGLDTVHDVLDSAAGFGMLGGGTLPFGGRDGKRAWEAMAAVVAQRWDEVLDTLDEVVRTPDVDGAAVTAAETELAEVGTDNGTEPADDDLDFGEPEEAARADDGEDDASDPVLAFWSDVGIDPVRITSGIGERYTLRCYLDDAPVFLGRSGRIHVFGSPRALARHLVEGTDDHDLAAVSTWQEVKDRAGGGELEVRVHDDNSYVLAGLADDLAEGPESVDPVQLELAVELLSDADTWAGGDRVERALAGSEPLGWLVSFVLRPDPTRLAPSPPFDAEVSAWRALVADLEDRLEMR
ncbi:MAG: primosomal protein [Pseudonocardiaceae bacterium]